MNHTEWKGESARICRFRWLLFFAVCSVFLVGASGDASAGEATPATTPDSDSYPQLRIGAWIDGSYQDNDRKGENHFLSYNHVNLHLDARFNESWQFFIEPELEFIPNLNGGKSEREFELERAFLQYNYDDARRIRFGLFNTPFGYWTPIHWSILMDTLEVPIHEKNRLTPEQQAGFRFFGSTFPDLSKTIGTEFSYSAYLGIGDESWGEIDPGNKGLSGGADLRVLLNETALFGFSYYKQRNAKHDNRHEQSAMLYSEIDLPANLVFRSELMHQSRNHRRAPGIARSINLFYAKLRWDATKRAYLNYRFSYGDDDEFDITSNHRIHTGTIGIHPIPEILIKLEYSAHEFREPTLEDYNFWGISIGYLYQ